MYKIIILAIFIFELIKAYSHDQYKPLFSNHQMRMRKYDIFAIDLMVFNPTTIVVIPF